MTTDRGMKTKMKRRKIQRWTKENKFLFFFEVVETPSCDESDLSVLTTTQKREPRRDVFCCKFLFAAFSATIPGKNMRSDHRLLSKDAAREVFQPRFVVYSDDDPDWLPSVIHPRTVVGVCVDIPPGVSANGFSCTVKSGGKTIRFATKENASCYSAAYTLGSVLSGEAVAVRGFQRCLTEQWNNYVLVNNAGVDSRLHVFDVDVPDGFALEIVHRNPPSNRRCGPTDAKSR